VRRPLSVGAEEEFFVVDAATGVVLDGGRALLRSPRLAAGPMGEGRFSDELRTCTVESKTSACHELDEVRAELCALRRLLVEAGRDEGVEVAAAGMFPTADWRTLGFAPDRRTEQMRARYARMIDEHVVCACHVHVGVPGRDTAVEVVNRVRPWLPVLLAISASSPLWMGDDTGYASYRSIFWERWPTAGMPPRFRSYEHYRRTVELMIGAQVSVDARQVHWDVRPGTSVETVEFRVADSCPTVDETIVQVGLSRALVRTCLDELAHGAPGAQLDPVLLRAAKWRAARYGLGELLLDPLSGDLVRAQALLETLLEHVRPALEEAGDWDAITAILTAAGGRTSADRQRAAFARSGRIADVCALLIDETARQA
jgi:carboxylate-amine ligase